ncbi:MAG: DUF456 domain-containing protein [Phycisphaerales bacterium]|nr:DUF456 domain-containing protein [Phycisphaerales bacterium]
MTLVVWQSALVIVAAAGVLATIVRLPGTWLILAAAAAYSWHLQWRDPSPSTLAFLGVLVVAAELIELAAGVVVARRAGATRRAGWCALIGGVAGMFVFTIPLPIIGTIIGGLIGCFLGAAIAEWTLRKSIRQGARVGFFAAVGQALGMAAKSLIALLMAGITIASVLA